MDLNRQEKALRWTEAHFGPSEFTRTWAAYIEAQRALATS